MSKSGWVMPTIVPRQLGKANRFADDLFVAVEQALPDAVRNHDRGRRGGGPASAPGAGGGGG
jgi:hypothetical protein